MPRHELLAPKIEANVTQEYQDQGENYTIVLVEFFLDCQSHRKQLHSRQYQGYEAAWLSHRCTAIALCANSAVQNNETEKKASCSHKRNRYQRSEVSYLENKGGWKRSWNFYLWTRTFVSTKSIHFRNEYGCNTHRNRKRFQSRFQDRDRSRRKIRHC